MGKIQQFGELMKLLAPVSIQRDVCGVFVC